MGTQKVPVLMLVPQEDDPLNCSLTSMDWLPRLNAKAGLVEVRGAGVVGANIIYLYLNFKGIPIF